MVGTSKKKDWVGLVATAAEILIEGQWDSSEDFDLSCEEPDGDVIDFNKEESEGGKLNNENILSCDVNKDGVKGKENIVYRQGGPIETGRYSVRLRQFENCGDGPTGWKVRVMIGGKIRVERSGTADDASEEVVTTVEFSYP